MGKPFVETDSVMLTMRIPLGLKNRIRDDIELEGDYSSMGAWMQAAAREYLEIREQKRNLRGGGVSNR